MSQPPLYSTTEGVSNIFFDNGQLMLLSMDSKYFIKEISMGETFRIHDTQQPDQELNLSEFDTKRYGLRIYKGTSLPANSEVWTAYHIKLQHFATGAEIYRLTVSDVSIELSFPNRVYHDAPNMRSLKIGFQSDAIKHLILYLQTSLNVQLGNVSMGNSTIWVTEMHGWNDKSLDLQGWFDDSSTNTIADVHAYVRMSIKKILDSHSTPRFEFHVQITKLIDATS